MKIREYFGEVKLNPEERKYLTKKIEKIKENFLINCSEEEILAELTVGQDKKKKWSLEVVFKVPKNIFQAAKEGFSLTEIMDEIEDVLVRQILRKKEKIQVLRKRGSRSLRKQRTIDEGARF